MNKNKGKAFCIILSILLCIGSVPVTAEAAAQDDSKTYTVTFNANGGTFDNTTANVTDTYGELPKPVKEYYTFNGWYTFPSGGVKIIQGNKVKIPRNHTLYAQWTGNPYTLTLDANGGKVSKETVTVYYGTKYLNQLPTPARENYVFDGWYTTAKAGVKVTSGTVFDETARKKLYAHWTPKKLTITLIAYNGDSYELEVTCGKKYGKLPKPVREGYKFGGWFTWEDFDKLDAGAVQGNKVAAETDPLMLFARWY
jgi:uncharacterized repeat protein (TIGR02543 family)